MNDKRQTRFDGDGTEMAQGEISAAELCAQLTFKARTLLRNGNIAATVETCMNALRCQDVPMEQGAILESLLRECDQIDLADQIRAQLFRGIEGVQQQHAESATLLTHIGNILILMGEHDLAAPYLQRALDLEPHNEEVLFIHALCHLENGSFQPGQIDIRPVLEKSDASARALASLVALLGFHNEKDEALRLLNDGLALLPAQQHASRLLTMRAALEGKTEQVNQRDGTASVFDKFAASYDESLAALANNGPEMIGAVLDQIGLPCDNTLRVFDAGCGTGLCEPYLRPRANLLHGADLSVGMLEKCLAKGTYDLLCRSDLAAAETLPGDTFDLTVCADVLVYFGALDQVFANLAGKLVPGGWLIFTVEEAPADIPAPGYGLNPSGRNCHGEAYLRKALERAGFTVEHTYRDTLRLEFRKPIQGLAMAARKTA